mmetsp:Transcript_14742/g.29764  ORF Transcript_14742/g.29764 Transcript_14742/m.29764 type:complete len:82 (-) Transcript_14742:825-1070(-)
MTAKRAGRQAEDEVERKKEERESETETEKERNKERLGSSLFEKTTISSTPLIRPLLPLSSLVERERERERAIRRICFLPIR